MSEDPNHRRPTNLGTIIEDVVNDHRHKPISDRAQFVWQIVFWSALGLGSFGYALYTMMRG